MKKIVFILSLLFILSVAKTQDSLESKFALDFVIPDMPAFKSLGTEPSDILRPSDVKQFALMLNPFYSNGKASLPKNFALEFAPWKMASKNWTLKDFDSLRYKRFLYRSSFSIGAVSDSTAFSSKLAIGYRVSFLSKNADLLRIAFNANNTFAEVADKTRGIKTKLFTAWISSLNPRPSAEEFTALEASPPEEYFNFLKHLDENSPELDDELKNTIREIKKIYGKDFNFSTITAQTFDSLQTATVTNIIEQYKRDNWNANRWDIAIALVGESADSIGTSARYSSFNVWTTYGHRLGRKGQLLIGGSVKLPNSAIDSAVSTPVQMSFSTRLLIGNSNFRFFAEGQFKSINYGQIDRSTLLNIGGEIRISKLFWAVASTGLQNLKVDNEADSRFKRFIANLDLRYGFR